jgi:hypothetical protein
MELALCVIGQMASREEHRESLGFRAEFRRRAGDPEVLLSSPLLGPLWSG